MIIFIFHIKSISKLVCHCNELDSIKQHLEFSSIVFYPVNWDILGLSSLEDFEWGKSDRLILNLNFLSLNPMTNLNYLLRSVF